SIEDKINRFAERDRHQIFVEPEGWTTIEMYINGFSTSLPEPIQRKAMMQIPGFENVKIFRPGYAIEYDYFPPTQLKPSLETKPIQGLFFAGQINGTTGYEEAACQGLMAGINAHLKINNKEEFVLQRSEAYIGVLIDDLINKGTDEPYRMFTSRAEFRILLRQDNADDRLTEKGYQLGLASEERVRNLESKRDKIKQLNQEVKNFSVEPELVNPILLDLQTPEINQKMKLDKLVLRPQVSLQKLIKLLPQQNIESEIIEQVELLIKYESYIAKEKQMADKLTRLDTYRIHPEFDFNSLQSLSKEAREKLSKIKPENIGQASRISGVSPSDISVLLIHLNR